MATVQKLQGYKNNRAAKSCGRRGMSKPTGKLKFAYESIANLEQQNAALKSRVETAEYLLDVERKVKAKSITECVELEAKVKELELFITRNTDDNLTVADMTIFREIFARHNQNNF